MVSRPQQRFEPQRRQHSHEDELLDIHQNLMYLFLM